MIDKEQQWCDRTKLSWREVFNTFWDDFSVYAFDFWGYGHSDKADDLVPNVRPLALQIYSNMDDAGSHCNMDNMKLALDTMIRWMIHDWYQYDSRVKRIMPGDNPGITVLVLKELY